MTHVTIKTEKKTHKLSYEQYSKSVMTKYTEY